MHVCREKRECVCVRACVFLVCVYLMAVSGRDTVVGCTQVRGSHNEVHVVVRVIILRREKWKEGGGRGGEGKGRERGGRGGEGKGRERRGGEGEGKGRERGKERGKGRERGRERGKGGEGRGGRHLRDR